MAGDAYCQDAAATILGYGLCYATTTGAELNYLEDAQRLADMQRATQMWASAARQGLWGSFDNLVTRGVGPVAEQARKIWASLEVEQPELVGRSGGAPVYGPDFVQEARRRFAEAQN